MIVRSIQNAEKNPKEISRWINSINELRKSKPHPTVNYSRAMPDIEQLMQVWPEDFEQALKQVSLLWSLKTFFFFSHYFILIIINFKIYL